MATMRKTFNFGNKKTLGHWFPRHMGKGLRQMRGMLRKVDCVIEVHDCRIPLSGRNPNLEDALTSKPRLLVYNKIDLAKPTRSELESLHERLKRDETTDYMFSKFLPETGGGLDESVSKLIPRCTELVQRFSRHDRETEASIDLMIVGVPNVGKSSLINALRRHHLGLRKGAPVGKSPGHTRSVMTKVKVCDKPLVYLHDTPGILEPRITNLHAGMKLALCNAVQDHMVGVAMIADYLLFTLNKKKQFNYVDKYSLKEPIDEIQPVLHNIATKNRKYETRHVMTGTGKQIVTIPNYEYAASTMLKDFQTGLLGQFILDDPNDDVTNANKQEI